MEHCYTVLDRGNGVAACSIAKMPEKYREAIVKQGGELPQVTFYFDKEQDLIVLNEDNEEYKGYVELIVEMMCGTDEMLLEAFSRLPEKLKAEFKNMFTILIAVKRYRELKEGGRHAEE